MDAMKVYICSCRWVPHQKNSADAMTKLRGHWFPLLKAAVDVFGSVVPEDQELLGRKGHREQTGKKNPKHGYQR